MQSALPHPRVQVWVRSVNMSSICLHQTEGLLVTRPNSWSYNLPMKILAYDGAHSCAMYLKILLWAVVIKLTISQTRPRPLF